MSFALAVASVWFSSCAAIGIALYYTHDIRCLWFLLIPTFVNIKCKDSKEEEDDVHEETNKE